MNLSAEMNLSTLQKYMNCYPSARPKTCQLVKVYENKEPADFKACFDEWQDDEFQVIIDDEQKLY